MTAFNGAPSPNIPEDTFGGLSSVRSASPFWDVIVPQLDPSNNVVSPWDRVFINGQVLPGICKVVVKKKKRFDVKKPKARAYPRTTFTGYELAELIITVRMWTAVQWNQMEAMMDVLEPELQVKDQLQPLDISHPACTMRRISSVLIENVDGPDDDAVKGMKVMKIHALEFRAPSNADVSSTQKNAGQYNVNARIQANHLTPLTTTPPSQGPDVNP